MNKQVWFITGASKGLGLILTTKLLDHGYRVASTSRKAADLVKVVGSASEDFLPLSMNITDEQDVARALQLTAAHFGQLDVIVNNAGYGLTGAIEELSDEETKENFNVNVFGSLNVIRQALPYLRKQSSGHLFNIASIGGFAGTYPGFGIYCATKFAVHGFSEGLYSELKPLGIKVTVVSPGYFRTNFLASGSLNGPKQVIEGYDNVRQILAAHVDEINGNQPGDPEKAAEAVIRTYLLSEPPLHLFLGSDAYELAHKKIEAVQKDLASVQEFAAATEFEESAVSAQNK